MPKVAALALGEPARGDVSCTAALVWHEGFQQSPAACSIPVVRETPLTPPPRVGRRRKPGPARQYRGGGMGSRRVDGKAGGAAEEEPITPPSASGADCNGTSVGLQESRKNPRMLGRWQGGHDTTQHAADSGRHGIVPSGTRIIDIGHSLSSAKVGADTTWLSPYGISERNEIESGPHISQVEYYVGLGSIFCGRSSAERYCIP